MPRIELGLVFYNGVPASARIGFLYKVLIVSMGQRGSMTYPVEYFAKS